MSARSHRDELFAPSARSPAPHGSSSRAAAAAAAAESKMDGIRKHSSAPEQPDVANSDDHASGPVQLEHMIGLGAKYANAAIMLTHSDRYHVKSTDSLVAIENLNDPNDQKLLRGHDMEVSALAASNSGDLIASGQLGTRNFKGYSAPIFVWDAASRQRIAVLRGLSQRVNLVSFSPDDKFVCGCGEDCLLYIWELATGEVVFGKHFATPLSFFVWVEQRSGGPGKRSTYELAYGLGAQVFQADLYFDAERVQWAMRSTLYGTPPSGGLVRYFHCAAVSPDLNYVYVGSTGAEMLVFSRSVRPVYKAAIPVCSNGVRCILPLPDGDVICGGGDGVVKRLRGADLSWEIIQQVAFSGIITSLSPSADAIEILVSTSAGDVYRCAAGDLEMNTIVSSCHLAPIKSIAFGSIPSYFVSGSENGEIRVWDTSDYGCQALLKAPKSGAVLSLCVIEGSESGPASVVMSGWSDGFIRCHDLQTLNRQMWYIANAHRGGVTSIAEHHSSNLQYVATGGNDGVVRIWRMSNRELIVQFSEHSKPVTRVLVDNTKPHLVHSCSQDMLVLTYDLKTQRRTVSHLVQQGALLDMSQRQDSEQELITCDAVGRLLHWDCDYRDPVAALQDPSGLQLYRCAVSPSSRYIAFAGQDGILKVVDVASSAVVGLGYGHSGPIHALHWAPDERQIVTGADDSSICVWNLFL